MVGTAVVLCLIFILLPFALSAGLSFTSQRLVSNPNLPTRLIGLDNYTNLISSPEFLQAFFNTALFAVLIVPLQCGLALGAALLINGALPARNAFRSIFFLPTVIAMVVVSVIWTNLYQTEGFFNAVVRSVSFGSVAGFDWLHDVRLAMGSILALSMWQGFGFQMVIYLAGLQQISPDLYEAARVDGARRWDEFRHVTMPGLRNTHIFVGITTTIFAFKLFTQVDLMTHGGPLGVTQTVVRFIYETGFIKGRVGLAAAASVTMFVIILMISSLQRIFLQEDREIR